MNEFGWDHMLKKLVCNFCGRNNGSDRKAVFAIVENIPYQERFACIFFTDNHNHRTFARINFAAVFNHINVELPKLKIHIIVKT
jgi:hypothetical protein